MAISHRHKTRAFTLIEMLIAIAIIGVLIGLLIPAIHKVRIASQGAATSAQMTAIATAIQAYYGDFKAYPGPLGNNQLGAAYQLNPARSPVNNYTVYVVDANNSGNEVELKLNIPASLGGSGTPQAFSWEQHITGPENLVLGLLGGLELTVNAGNQIQSFCYNPADIFPDGINPSPLGANGLNNLRPKHNQAYLQVRPGQLSGSGIVNGMINTTPNVTDVTNGNFTDTTGVRSATDSIIPEFLDQFAQQMPILYLRTNPGGTAVVSIGGGSDNGPPQLQDYANNPVTAQYDLAQILDYTNTLIGTTTNYPIHGLRRIGTNPGDTITSGYQNSGQNGLAYFRVPSGYNAMTPANSMPNTLAAPASGLPVPAARQQDGFLLISPGPDGIYGTADDIIYPGSLNP